MSLESHKKVANLSGYTVNDGFISFPDVDPRYQVANSQYMGTIGFDPNRPTGPANNSGLGTNPANDEKDKDEAGWFDGFFSNDEKPAESVQAEENEGMALKVIGVIFVVYIIAKKV